MISRIHALDGPLSQLNRYFVHSLLVPTARDNGPLPPTLPLNHMKPEIR